MYHHWIEARVLEGKSSLEGDELETAARNIGYGEECVVVLSEVMFFVNLL